MSEPSNEPRIQIDADWKAQAQAEKERLAEKEAQRGPKGGGRAGPSDLPPADFRSLVGILASQAMSGLGLYGDEKGRVIVDPIGAKFAIDLLGVLEEKSRGNLSKEEADDLESVLRELRLRFVQVIDMLARQDVRAGAASAGGAVPPIAPSSASADRPAASPSSPGAAPPPGGSGAGPRIIVP